jgi:hypothetical protein
MFNVTIPLTGLCTIRSIVNESTDLAGEDIGLVDLPEVAQQRCSVIGIDIAQVATLVLSGIGGLASAATFVVRVIGWLRGHRMYKKNALTGSLMAEA